MELFHALNRGVDGRNIFLDSKDYARFVHDLFEFNDQSPATNINYALTHHAEYIDLRSRYIGARVREKLVDIHGWCLMKNHYHLLLSERVEGGISLFLRKLNIGYAKYFNERYERRGTLFQGRTKKILIERDAHFLYILHYIHLNPLDYLGGAEEWRVRSKNGIKNAKQAFAYLEQYRWSSYLDYIGKENFPSILTTSLFKDVFTDYPQVLKEYLEDADVGVTPLLPLE